MSAFFTLVRADSIKASTGCQWYINRAAMGCQPGVALTFNSLLIGWQPVPNEMATGWYPVLNELALVCWQHAASSPCLGELPLLHSMLADQGIID